MDAFHSNVNGNHTHDVDDMASSDILGSLTMMEAIRYIPSGSYNLEECRTRESFISLIAHQPLDVKRRINDARKKHEDEKIRKKRKKKDELDVMSRVKRTKKDDEIPLDGRDVFMELPDIVEKKYCYDRFLQATSNEALAMSICVVCARELFSNEGEIVSLLDIPDVRQSLSPKKTHRRQELWEGILIVRKELKSDGRGWVCYECYNTLLRRSMPKLSLANNMWIGEALHILRMLTLGEQILIGRYHPRFMVIKLYPKQRSNGFGPDQLQRGLCGNVVIYELNSEAIVRMLEGQLMPQTRQTLASVVGITLIGTKKLPKKWLHSTFRIRRRMVYEALMTLVSENTLFADIQISHERLMMLPEDGIPDEITSIIGYEPNENLAYKEKSGYVPENDTQMEIEIDEEMDDEQMEAVRKGQPNLLNEESDVVPLERSGVVDTDLSRIPTNNLMKYALSNLMRNDKEAGYVVRYHKFASDLGPHQKGITSNKPWQNPMMAAYPILWPYGVGGIEEDREKSVSFNEHVKWALQYYDRRFRIHHSFMFVAFGIRQKREALRSSNIQIRRRDFEHDNSILGSITLKDLEVAADEEERGMPVSNFKVQKLLKHVYAASGRVLGSNNSRALYRGHIWGTILYLNPPSLWLTVNPVDVHDPIAQIFAGEQIDMDHFIKTTGPSPQRRAMNVAKDPYAATRFFHYALKTMMETLFAIQVTRDRVYSHMGVLGVLSAYIGIIEAQGRGSLHIHMILWLKNAPNAEEMKELLKSQEFQNKIISYIKENIRAHLDSFGETQIKQMMPKADFAYSRPPNPKSPTWQNEVAENERMLVRSLQIHTCSKNSCLVVDKTGRLICKRRAPWPISDEDFVMEDGTWSMKRTYGFINGYNPSVLVYMRCNNDIKLLTNGQETKDAAWYFTMYGTKKQNRAFNQSALLAKAYFNHEERSKDLLDIRKKNRLLLFRCFQILNRQMEYSSQQVISYLMDKGDAIFSHHYVPFYWSSLASHLSKAYPELSSRKIVANADTSTADVYTKSAIDKDEDNQDVIMIEADGNGNLIPRSNIKDYELRGPLLESMSILEFVVDTYEEAIPKAMRNLVDKECQDEKEIALYLEKKRENGHQQQGRPASVRSYYHPKHPKHQTMRRVIRGKGHNSLPTIVGPFFPRHDIPNRKDQFYAAVMSTLKPWRDIKLLKLPGESWESAYNIFVATCSKWTQNVISGMRYHYESKASAERNQESQSEKYKERFNTNKMQDLIVDDDDDGGVAMDDEEETITESDLEDIYQLQSRTQEFIHGDIAVEIAQLENIFDVVDDWTVEESSVEIASGDDNVKLEGWLTSMEQAIASSDSNQTLDNNLVDVEEIADLDVDVQIINEVWSPLMSEEEMPVVDLKLLFPDQRRAYDIIEWHLNETIAQRNPNQLLMNMMGEGGTGKSAVIQTVTDLFTRKTMLETLAKGAYTGIAASVIGGSTLHGLAMIPLNGKKQSMKTIKKLEASWANIHYLIIDEMSMVSKKLLSMISDIVARAKAANIPHNDLPFGGVNVILAGDFHQFPPVVSKNNAPLYYPANPETDSLDELNGRRIYEQFETVVCLKQQIRVIDPVWTDILRHVQFGSCCEEHLNTLRRLIVTNPECPAIENQSDWTDAVLVTPRHGVRIRWNQAALRSFCAKNKRQIFQSPSEDTVDRKPLTVSQRYSLAMSKSMKCQEKTGLASSIELAVGMKVMVTFNVKTELDIANGARGVVVDIILDERETAYDKDKPMMKLAYPPSYILVQLNRTKMPPLQGLPKGVVPIVPMSKRFTITTSNNEKFTFTRRQLPITGAYALTDYRGQGQTLVPVYVDIGMPPNGKHLTPFNAYVTLSRGRGQKDIRLIRDFEDRMFTQHPNKFLRDEDTRLYDLDAETRSWWELVNTHKQAC